jgi:hypothetical protein
MTKPTNTPSVKPEPATPSPSITKSDTNKNLVDTNNKILFLGHSIDQKTLSMALLTLLPVIIITVLLTSILLLPKSDNPRPPIDVSIDTSTSSSVSQYSSSDTSYSSSTDDMTRGECIVNKELTPPRNKFVAHYFEGNSYVCSEIVDNIQKSYAWSEFKDIKSEDFRAEYSGSLYFDQETYKTINADLSWSKLKIIINEDMVANWTNQTEKIGYTFQQGENKVRIEYDNNWHTVGYAVSFDDPVNKTNLQKAITKAGNFGQGEIYLVGVYEGGSNYNVNLVIQNTDKPIDLILTSYHKIEWNLVGPNKDKVQNVFIQSYSDGSRVTGGNSNLKIFHLDGIDSNEENRKYVISLLPRCPTNAPSIPEALLPDGVNAQRYCEDYGSLPLLLSIEQATGKRPTGFAGGYDPTELIVPATKLDEAAYQKLTEDTNRIYRDGSPRQDEEEDCVRVGGDKICGGRGNDLIR